MKRHKDPVKTSKTNKDPQVFVLPPDLLEKLGIQLANIPATTSAEETPDLNRATEHLEVVPEDAANSSILETANLMKQSVFMSPTFITNTGTGDETVSENSTTVLVEGVLNVEVDKELTDTVINDSCNNVKHKSDTNSDNFIKYESIKEYEVDNDSGDLFLTNCNEGYKENNTVISDSNNMSLVDEHIDEAYSSDGSNSNPGTASEISSNNSLLNKELQNTNSKIQIISETVIQNSDNDSVKRTQNSKKNSCFLIPVNVNTIVTPKVPKGEDHEGTATVSKDTEHECIVKKYGIIQDKLTLEDIDFVTEVIDNTENGLDKIDEGNDNCDVGSNNFDKNENIKELNTDKEQIMKMVTEKASNTKKMLTKSKLSIQGVEKPGGDFKHSGLKTYQRKNIQKRIPEINYTDLAKNSHDSNLLEHVEADLNEINISGYIKANTFCNCNDFGLLMHYNDDDTSEHIHFRNHSIVAGSLETVLRMYNEECDLYNRCDTEYIEEVNVIETAKYDICWLSLIEMGEEIDEQLIEDRDKYARGYTESQSRRSIYEKLDEITTKRTNKTTQPNRKSSRKLYRVKEDTSEDFSAKYQICKAIFNTPPNKGASIEECTGSQLQEIDIFSSCRESPQKLSQGQKCINKEKSSTDFPDSHYNNSEFKSPIKSFETCASAKLYKKDKVENTHMTADDSGIPFKNKKSQSNQISTNLQDVQSPTSTVTSQPKHKTTGRPETIALNAKSEHKGNTEIQCAQTTSTGNNSAPNTDSQSSGSSAVSNVEQDVIATQSNSNSSRRSDGLEKDDPPPAESMYLIEIKTEAVPKCAVCKLEVHDLNWIEHIAKEHNYLAWREDETPLDLDDELAIRMHLGAIVKRYGVLRCSKCNAIRKYAKAFRSHVKRCELNESQLNSTADMTLNGDESQQTIDDASRNRFDVSDITNTSLIDDEDNTPLRSRSRGRRRSSRVPAATVSPPRDVTCGVCSERVPDENWVDHIRLQHKYLAWKKEEPPVNVNDDIEVKIFLQNVSKNYGGLMCSNCGVVKMYVKSWVEHETACKGETSQKYAPSNSDMNTSIAENEDNSPLISNSRRRKSRKSTLAPPSDVTCAVCHETVSHSNWIEHIRLQHNYLAWKSGDPPLDVNNDQEVKIYLQNISKYNGGLICNKCGTTRNYVKNWYDHIKLCNGANDDQSSSSEDMVPLAQHASRIEIEIPPETVRCGKCSKEMPKTEWMAHSEIEHNYLCWLEGEPPLNENNPEEVNIHLQSIVKKIGCLLCPKCGTSRKYPKSYLTHISACEISGFNREDFFVEISADVRPDQFECAVCRERGPLREWKSHVMSKHYNIAWMTGETPINLKNPYAVEKYLKEYKSKHNLVCKVCQATRASCYGFYAHILTCGKKESEMENLMNTCDICQNKYLCIYRNQHIQMHREQQRTKEKKELAAIKAEEEEEQRLIEAVPKGKRLAAHKAKKVMEKYTGGSHVCETCQSGFKTDVLLKEHICDGPPGGDSDSDASVKLEVHEESDDDMEVDSNASAEEEAMELDVEDDAEPKKKRKRPESIPKVLLPYKVANSTGYLQRSFDDFCKRHCSTTYLFNDWRCKPYTVLPKSEAFVYLPSLTNSCKIRIGSEWSIYERFQADKKRDRMTLFTGATIRCMQWVPNKADQVDNYLSVACFQSTDCPRYTKDSLHQHPGLLQIWKFGTFMTVPKFEFGIAHDYGTVWAMDWCPSGARDFVPHEDSQPTELRLGLLAIACSNGSAYILSVPHIRQEEGTEPIILKLKPVAELRIAMKPKDVSCRKTYQATAVSWSPQKGHELVSVGYSDGTLAYYNLNTNSPFLKSLEEDVRIIYPFHDARPENAPVTGVSMIASQDERRLVGNVATSSATGATLAAWPAGPVARSHLSCGGVMCTPNWPAAVLCSDDVLTAKSANVLEWWGGGRRFGGGCASCACVYCDRLCLVAPPFVRLLRSHPCYPELKKQIIATLRMVLLAKKRKLKTDDLGMVVEPLTYDETIQKYGIEFVPLSKKNQTAGQLGSEGEQCPERFPLSDMPSVAFCPSPAHHNRLAIATHAGFIFIVVT